MCNVGKPPLAPTPMASNATRRVTFGPTTAATTTPATVTTATPTAVAGPTTTHVMSRASEFDKGGQRLTSDYGKLQNREQWSKWHRALMGNAYEHKCEQVLDPSYTPNPSDPDEVALFRCWLKARLAMFCVSTRIHEIKQNFRMLRKSMPICVTSTKEVL